MRTFHLVIAGNAVAVTVVGVIVAVDYDDYVVFVVAVMKILINCVH